jgi:DNA adenine methylase
MESTPLAAAATARPVSPVAPYVGGKRNLAGRLVRLIDQVDHELYAEAFVGMGGVFLRRRRRPRYEVINDASADVATLFRVLQRHYVAFLEMLRWQLTTRAEFERLTATDPATLTDLERAARFLYLQRTAFGGKVTGRNFAMGLGNGRHARFDVTRLAPLLEDVHARLAGVLIERLDFAAFLTRYDAVGALFYCDPPYWGAEDYYGAELFARADFERLHEALAALKGRFLLSINDVPEIRALFAGFRQIPVATTYHLQANGTALAGELIIANFDPPPDSI